MRDLATEAGLHCLAGPTHVVVLVAVARARLELWCVRRCGYLLKAPIRLTAASQEVKPLIGGWFRVEGLGLNPKP